MRTEELVAMLAQGAGASERGAPARRHAIALGGGGLASFALMVVTYGIRPTLLQDMTLAMFWAKFGFVAVLAIAGGAAVVRLARPGAPLAGLSWALAAPVVAMWLLAVADLATATGSEARASLVLGQTWQACSSRIAILSVPVFVALMWSMRGLAPTRLRLAGAASGLCAGALGALAYSLHCPELAAPFLGIWYVLGMLLPAAAGALIGPRVLRW